jgi:hypothetical protein
VPLSLSNCPDILTLSEVTIKKAYLDDIFNVSYLEVTVTSNDILRIEIKRSSTSVLIDFTYLYGMDERKALKITNCKNES